MFCNVGFVLSPEDKLCSKNKKSKILRSEKEYFSLPSPIAGNSTCALTGWTLVFRAMAGYTYDDNSNRVTLNDRSGSDIVYTHNSANEYTGIGGPLAQWKLDDGSGSTAADSIGGNDGTLTNFPTDDSQWVSGMIGESLEFDGTDDYVNLGTGLGPTVFGGSSGASTISAWV